MQAMSRVALSSTEVGEVRKIRIRNSSKDTASVTINGKYVIDL